MKTRSEVKLFRLGMLCLFSCLVVGSAGAELFIFGQITGNDGVVCPDAFSVEIVPQADDQALFTFTNNCDSDGVLTRIFVKENDLITFNSIFDQSEGVSFSDPDWKNAMLPGGHDLGFTPQNTYSIDADPAAPKNGLHYQEFVSVLFDINTEGGIMFDDIITSVGDGTLGLGLHAQSLPGGASASFSTVPEPITLSLLGLGVLFARNKRRGTAQ